MGDILLGILGGFGEATQRQNLMDMQAEIEKRKELASFWEKQAADESQRPEAREEAARRYLLIKRTPYGKPLPKEGKDLESWADVQLKAGKSLLTAQPVPVPPGQMPAATLPPSPGMDAGAPPIQAAPAPVAALAPPIPAPPRTAGPFITPGERNQQATEAIQSQVAAKAQAEFQAKYTNARAMIAGGMDPDEAFTRAGLPQPRPEPRARALQMKPGTVDGKPVVALFDPDSGALLNADTKKPITGKFVPGAEGSIDQQSLDQYMKDNPGKGPLDYVKWKTALGPSIRLSLEQNARTSGMLDSLPKPQQTRIRSIARRVAERELTITQAMGLVGGVRGKMGLALEEAISDMDARIVPTALTAQLNSTAESLKILDRVEGMVNQINKTPKLKDKITQSAVLEGFLKQQIPLMARALGHVGVLTQQDVDSVRGFFPGWKSANFAPKFAAEKIKVMKERFAEHKKIIEGESFRMLSRTGAVDSGPPPGSAPAAPIVQRNKRTGAVRYSLDGGNTWQNGNPPQ